MLWEVFLLFLVKVSLFNKASEDFDYIDQYFITIYITYDYYTNIAAYNKLRTNSMTIYFTTNVRHKQLN